ncbi:MAG: hypothetical protein ACI4QM_00920 [Alphaproteobacteria bacterium]
MSHNFIADILLEACKKNDTKTALGCFVDMVNPARYTCATDEQGRSAFMWAFINKNETLVRAFSEVGTRVNQPDANGWTIAMYAVRTNKPLFVELAVQAGAVMDYQHNGLSPLGLAYTLRNKALIKAVTAAVQADRGSAIQPAYVKNVPNFKKITSCKKRLFRHIRDDKQRS